MPAKKLKYKERKICNLCQVLVKSGYVGADLYVCPGDSGYMHRFAPALQQETINKNMRQLCQLFSYRLTYL